MGQLVSLAQIMLGPFYRKIKGFQVLVENAFGNPFRAHSELPKNLRNNNGFTLISARNSVKVQITICKTIEKERERKRKKEKEEKEWITFGYPFRAHSELPENLRNIITMDMDMQSQNEDLPSRTWGYIARLKYKIY